MSRQPHPERQTGRWQDWLSSPWVMMAVAITLLLPSLWGELQLDDFYHWGVATQHPLLVPAEHPLSWGMFTFFDGDAERTQQIIERGLVPWWVDPHLKYSFWRPLTELTHFIDYQLLDGHTFFMHVHHLIYVGVFLWLGYGVLSIWLSGRALQYAGWALALSYTHGFVAGWLANRNALLSGIFLLLTVKLHHAWRQQPPRYSMMLLALLCFVLGLLAGELGAATGLVLLAYSMILDPAIKAPNVLRSIVPRIMTLLPYMLIGVVWLATRYALGYGVQYSGHYISPGDPLEFIAVLGQRLTALLNGLFWSLPPEILPNLDARVTPVLFVFTLTLLIFVWRLPAYTQAKRFMMLALLFTLIPVSATEPHSRLLVVAGVFLAGLFGTVMAPDSVDQPASSSPSKLHKLIAGILCVSLLFLAPLFTVFEAVAMKISMNGLVNSAAANLNIDAKDKDKTHVIINPPLSSVATYILGVRAYHNQALPNALVPLVSGAKGVYIESNPDGSRLLISSPDGIYDAVIESLLRSDKRPLSKGDRVTVGGMVITVEQVNNAGVPVTISVDVAAQKNQVVFYVWHAGLLKRCDYGAQLSDNKVSANDTPAKYTPRQSPVLITLQSDVCQS